MKNVGVEIPNELFPALERARVIEEFERPLLIEYREPRSGERYLYSWVSCDHSLDLTRWMVFRAPSRALAAYLKQLISFWDLIQSTPNGTLYLVDHSQAGTVVKVFLIAVDQLPDDYRPKSSAHHDIEDRPSGFHATSPWTLLTNQKWNLQDLHQVPHLYRKVYNGLYAFGHVTLPQDRHGSTVWKNAVTEYDVDIAEGRGGAATRLYKHIEGTVPPENRVSLERVQLASPGEITLRLHCDVAEALQKSVHAFNQSGGTDHYNRLYLERHRDETDISVSELETRAVTMCELLRVDWARALSSFPQLLTRADFLLAQARYTQSLAKYLREEKIESF